MLLQGKRVDYRQLRTEMIAAGLTVPQALGQAGDDLHTYDANGVIIDVPAGAAAVIAAHVPPPLPVPADMGNAAETEDQARANLQTRVDSLRAFLDQTNNTVTLIQLVQFMKVLTRVVLYLVRRSGL
jgi:hypothetical protein